MHAVLEDCCYVVLDSVQLVVRHGDDELYVAEFGHENRIYSINTLVYWNCLRGSCLCFSTVSILCISAMSLFFCWGPVACWKEPTAQVSKGLLGWCYRQWGDVYSAVRRSDGYIADV
jgi:hypothetical protein